MTCMVIITIFIAREAVCQKKMSQDGFYKEPVLEVSTALWCNSVKDGVLGKKITKAKIGQPFYLLVSFTGKQEALDLLKENPTPVVAKWFRYSSLGFDIEDGGKQSNELALLKSNSKWFSAKQFELKKNGKFTFSFWTNNSSLRRTGIYYVHLVYYDNTPVQCGDAPCEYKITITN